MNSQEPAAPQNPPPAPAVDMDDVKAGRDINVATDNAQIGGNRAGRDINIYNALPVGVQSLHQIPPPPADFTGREAELDELVAPMGQRGVNISGVAGMGGVGKTALALALADLIEGNYPDAQLFLDMRGASDQPRTPASAMESVIRAFHPTAQLPEDEEVLRHIYLSVLDSKRALLFLDDARDRAQVAPLLPPESCALIVTSRQYFVLPNLHPLRLDILSPEEAKALLQKIATRLSDAEAEEMATLCGYLPLALTLAGSALAERPDLTPADYLRRLADVQKRLELVEASLALSYNLLDEAHQQRWRMLTVFPATFDRFAAAVVWGAENEAELEEAREYLSTLLRYSLVEWREAEDRYRLHDLARLFADAQLTDEERTTIERRHAEHFLQVLHTAHQFYLSGGDGVMQGLSLFDAEWPNIQTGQAWAATHAAQDDVAAWLCSSYPYESSQILEFRQHPREQIRWLDSALSAARHLKDRYAEGAHLTHTGRAYMYLGEVRQALYCFEQALVIDRRIGDRRGEGADLRNLGNVYADLGEVQQAIDYYQQDLAIAREIGDRHAEGAALGSLGNAYFQLGEMQQAIDYDRKALVIHREVGDGRGEGIALWNMSLALDELGERQHAIPLAEVGLGIFEQIGDPYAETVRCALAEWRSEQSPS